MKTSRIQFSKPMFAAAVLLLHSGLVVSASANEAEESVASTPPADVLGDVDHLAFRTVERRQNAALQAMLLDGLPANLRAPDGTTLLMYAAMHGDVHGIRLLLNAGANPNSRNEAGGTALIYGAAESDKVQALLAAGSEINAVTKKGVSALIVAATNTEGLDSVKLLLAAGAKGDVEIDMPFGATLTALTSAAKYGNLETVKALIDHQSGSDAAVQNLSAALFMAAKEGRVEVAEYLTQWNGPGHVPDNQKSMPLWAGLASGEPSITRSILDSGASIDPFPFPGLQPGFFTGYSEVDDTGIVQMLLDEGLDVENNPSGAMGLWAAERAGNVKMAAALREAGASLSALPSPPKNKKLPDNGIPLSDVANPGRLRGVVEKSVGLMLNSSDVFLKNRNSCTSCHHQDMPAIAANVALTRGIKVPLDSLERLHRAQERNIAQRIDELYEGTSGAIYTSAFMLWEHSVAGKPADALTKAMVRFLAGVQHADGHWDNDLSRTPMQYGHHIVTALAIRAFQTYPLAGREAEMAARIDRALSFLRRNPAYNHTDEVFTLMGLVWGNAPTKEVQTTAASIQSRQREDGGWAQRANMNSDAWATGIALCALHTAGIKTTDEVYRRGMQYLLNTQFDDGSWYVQSRTLAIQPHFDSQFPHGKDQWISMAATAFATASLGLALEPQPVDTATLLVGLGDAKPSSLTEPETPGAPFEFTGVRTISFEKQVRPVLEEKCTDCHGTQRAKGNLNLATRKGLLKGGESRVQLVELGNGSESQIIRHILGQVEDMEMPPLQKRKTYPALSSAEVQMLVKWIDEGAQWPEGLELDD